MDPKCLVSAFSTDVYTETEVPKQMFDVIFENETQLLGKEHGQEKCKDLTFPFARSHLKNVVIKNSNILLEPENDSIQAKEIREITLDWKDFKDFNWQPCDTIAILPNNANECVDELLKLLDLDKKADTICSVKISKLCSKKSAKVPSYIPNPTTPREILRDCLNLGTILSKRFLRSLAEYCTDNEDKKFLKNLSSKEGSLIYNGFLETQTLTLKNVLMLCKTCKPPLNLLIEHLSRLLPRPYSIANSPLKVNDEITLIFSKRVKNPGVTTKMLKEKSLKESSTVLIYLRESNSFRYTEDNYQQNQILIAIGTGVAPFLGLLQHKQHLMNKNKEKPGIIWLFLGTTTQQSVIHRTELIQWQSENVINNFFESYSCTPTARFHYIQEALLYNARQLVELLMKPETYLYLCADGGKISKSIEYILKKILAKELVISEAESTEMLKTFKTNGKYREDIWL